VIGTDAGAELRIEALSQGIEHPLRSAVDKSRVRLGIEAEWNPTHTPIMAERPDSSSPNGLPPSEKPSSRGLIAATGVHAQQSTDDYSGSEKVRSNVLAQFAR
jgi:hypothetical protein